MGKVLEELVKGKEKVWEKLGNGKGKFSKELVKGIKLYLLLFLYSYLQIFLH